MNRRSRGTALLLFAFLMVIFLINGKEIKAEETDRTAANEYEVSDTIKAVLYSDGALEITGEGALGESWSSTGNVPWYSQRTSIKTVVVSDKITSVGKYAFYNCTALTKVTLPDGVTSIGQYAFQNCSSLASMTLPEGVTSIGQYAFQNCTKLASMTLPDGITEVAQHTFYGCSALAKVSLPEGITTIGNGAFYNCKTLGEITLPESLTKIENYAFQNCAALTSVRIPAAVTTMNSNSFSGCSKLVKVTFGYGMEKVPDYACSNMTALTDVILETGSNDEAAKVTSIGQYAFQNCSSLASMTLPEGVTSIGQYAFQNCTKLASMTLPDGITEVAQHTFYGCSALAKVSLPEGITTIGNGAFYNCKTLGEITLPESLTKIENYAFQNCTALTSVRIPAAVTTMNSNSFSGCSKLVKVTFGYGMEKVPDYACSNMTALTDVIFETGGNDEAAKVTSIGQYTFQNCSSLASMTLPDGVTAIGQYAFQNCASLASMSLPEGITTIGNGTFYNCKKLAKIILPDGLKTIGYRAFASCNALTEITIPASVTAGGNGEWFANAEKLTNITLEEGTTSTLYRAFRYLYTDFTIKLPDTLTTIGNASFDNCSGLTEIDLPDNVTTIDIYAFNNCKNLKNVVLPEKLTSLGKYAFQSCTALEEITLPEKVTTIAGNAFYGCSALDYLDFKGQITSVGSNAFYTGTEIETMVAGEMTDALTGYNWEGSNRNLSKAQKSYKAGEKITATLFDSGLLMFRGSGAMDSWTADTVPWKDDLAQISSMDIGDGITTVGTYAAAGTGITFVSLGDDITSVGANAFKNCADLRCITIGSSLTSIGEDAFGVDSATMTILTTENTAAQAYDWAGDNRSLVTDGTTYSLTKRIQAYLIGTALYVTGFGSMPDYSSSSVPWKSAGLTSVTIGNEIRRIGNYSFYGQTSLSKITMGDKVTSLGNYAFMNCSSLKTVSLSEDVAAIGTNCFYGCSALADINYDKTDITEVSQNCFYNCTSLKRVVISSKIKKVCTNAFYGCSNVNTLRMEEGVTEIQAGAFNGCSKLTSVKIPRSIKTVGKSSNIGPFGNCENLTEVTFAEKARSIPANLLAGVTGLASVTLPKTVSTIGDYAFYGCSNLQAVTMPLSMAEIGNYAFGKCTSLAKVECNEYLQKIGNYAFTECSALTEITLPDSVQTLGNYAFYNDSQLKTVNLGNGISSISSACFRGVAAEEIVLPYKVTSIGSYAFADNDKLVRITIPGTTKTINSNAFSQSTMTVYGEAGSQAETMANNKGYTFVAGTAADSVELNEQSAALALNEQKELKASFAPETMVSAFTWSSGDTAIATVTADSSDPAKAVIKGIKAGETDITVAIGEKKAVCHVTVGNYITSLNLNTTYKRFTSAEQTLQLKATKSPSSAQDEDFVWTSSDSNVVTVDENGLVTPKNNGQARIIVATADGRVSAYCLISVEMNIPAEGITVTPETLLLTTSARQLTAKVTPSNATDKTITWTSSDTSVATVDGKGNVTPVAAGTAEITASVLEGAYKASCKVTVKEIKTAAEEIILPQEEIELSAVGQTAAIGASVSPADADMQTLLYTSSDPAVASVDKDGVVTATGGGSAVITIETEDGNLKTQCQITVNRLIRSMEVNPGSLTLAIGGQQKIAAVIEPSDALDQEVGWYSTNRKVASVDEEGLVTAISAGTAYIRCMAQDGSGQSASCLVTVTDPSKPSEPEQPTAGKKEETTTQNKKEQTGTAAVGPKETKVTVAKSKITGLKVKKRKVTVKWKKVKGSGYQIQISKKKNFAKLTWQKNISSASKTKCIVKGLKKGKYYVRIRVQSKQKGKMYYSSWSAKKKLKVK